MADQESSTSLVALRDRREAAIQLLSDRFARDVISMGEFEDRLSRAHAATTVVELDALIADLDPSAGTSTALVPLKVNTQLVASGRPIRSIFGSVERRGSWVVAARVKATSLFGHVELDFRDARFTSGVTVIDVSVVFGNLEIIVPPNLAVECEGSSFFGNMESHASGVVADPDRPILRVRGTAVFGNVEVHTRLPGETEEEAEEREEDERDRPALPAGRSVR